MLNQKFSSYANYTKYLGIAIAAAMILSLFFGFGFYFGNKIGSKKGYQSGITAMSQTVDRQLEFLLGEEPKEIYQINGQIREIRNTTLTVVSSQYLYGLTALDSIAKGKGRSQEIEIKIEISPETALEKFVTRDEEVSTEKITASQLQVGSNITIDASTNIKGEKRFQAKRVRLIE